uniref:Uncharacterized protein n=1 Tax=Glossina brevipalpis TaxID=37001 RepID=A0A1A9WKH8_9MUSC
MINVIFAKSYSNDDQNPESLKYGAYSVCASQARIDYKIDPMIDRRASDLDIARVVFKLKSNDEDEFLSSHCFYYCVFQHMGLTVNPGGMLKTKRKTKAFGQSINKRAIKKCLDVDEINLCRRFDFFFINYQIGSFKGIENEIHILAYNKIFARKINP